MSLVSLFTGLSLGVAGAALVKVLRRPAASPSSPPTSSELTSAVQARATPPTTSFAPQESVAVTNWKMPALAASQAPGPLPTRPLDTSSDVLDFSWLLSAGLVPPGGAGSYREPASSSSYGRAVLEQQTGGGGSSGGGEPPSSGDGGGNVRPKPGQTPPITPPLEEL